MGESHPGVKVNASRASGQSAGKQAWENEEGSRVERRRDTYPIEESGRGAVEQDSANGSTMVEFIGFHAESQGGAVQVSRRTAWLTKVERHVHGGNNCWPMQQRDERDKS